MLKDLGLLTLRLGTGWTMVAHGYSKLFGGPEKEPPETLVKAFGENYKPAFQEGGPERFAEKLEEMDVPMPRAAAYASGLAELAGGLSLLLGFKTRLAALLILVNLGVAIRKAHWKTGFFGQSGFEFPLALAQSAFGLLLMGPGRLAIDCEARKETPTLKEKSQRELDRLRDKSENEIARLKKQSEDGLETLQAASARGVEALRDRSEHGLEKVQDVADQGLEELQKQSARGFSILRRKSQRGFKDLKKMVPASLRP